MANLYYIKNSNDADKNDEYFWLNIKELMLKFASDEINIEINKLSGELNLLQKEKDYQNINDKINIFLKKNINLLCISLFTKYLSDNENNTRALYISRFVNNLNKWIIINKDRKIDLLFDDKLTINLVIIMGGYTNNKFTTYYSLFDYVKELIILNSRETIKEFEINRITELKDKIFTKSIMLNAHKMVDYMKNWIDNYRLYFKDDKTYNIEKTTNCPKLILIIKENNTDYFNKMKN